MPTTSVTSVSVSMPSQAGIAANTNVSDLATVGSPAFAQWMQQAIASGQGNPLTGEALPQGGNALPSDLANVIDPEIAGQLAGEGVPEELAGELQASAKKPASGGLDQAADVVGDTVDGLTEGVDGELDSALTNITPDIAQAAAAQMAQSAPNAVSDQAQLSAQSQLIENSNAGALNSVAPAGERQPLAGAVSQVVSAQGQGVGQVVVGQSAADDLLTRVGANSEQGSSGAANPAFMDGAAGTAPSNASATVVTPAQGQLPPTAAEVAQQVAGSTDIDQSSVLTQTRLADGAALVDSAASAANTEESQSVTAMQPDTAQTLGMNGVVTDGTADSEMQPQANVVTSAAAQRRDTDQQNASAARVDVTAAATTINADTAADTTADNSVDADDLVSVANATKPTVERSEQGGIFAQQQTTQANGAAASSSQSGGQSSDQQRQQQQNLNQTALNAQAQNQPASDELRQQRQEQNPFSAQLQGAMNADSSSNSAAVNPRASEQAASAMMSAQAGMNSGAQMTRADQTAQTQQTLSDAAMQQLRNPNWAQGIGSRATMMAQYGPRTAELKLDPPELGALQIRVHINHQDQVSVSFTSPHAAVRDAIEQQMPRLREMFNDQGLQLGQSDVSDNSSQDQGRDSSNQSGQGLSYQGSNVESSAEMIQVPIGVVDYYA